MEATITGSDRIGTGSDRTGTGSDRIVSDRRAHAGEDGFSLSGVGYAVAGKAIVRDIDARFGTGRIHGLIGPNGSGKTSLLRMLARQIQPSAGTIEYRNEKLARWAARDFAREVAFVPQQLPAGQQLTARELVALGRYPWHGPFRGESEADRAAIDEAIRIADVERFSDRLVDTLSGGERQRVWVAMMVAQAGRFLILDEPTSALDIAHQAHLLELLHEVARERRLGVVMAFHDINIAARFCDEVLAMKEGALIARGTPDEIISAETLSRLYDVAMATLPHPDTKRPIGFIR